MLRTFFSKFHKSPLSLFQNSIKTLSTNEGKPAKSNGLSAKRTPKASQPGQRLLFSKKKNFSKTEIESPLDTLATQANKSIRSQGDMSAAVKAPEDDVHARRFMDMSKLEGEDTFLSLRNELYKFTFDYTLKSIDVNLNDINIVNIENEETFHKIPKLAHNLDVILRKPGVYPIESLIPLQADGGHFLKNIVSPDDVDVDRIPPYIPPSQDSLLMKFAKESKIKYVMSTSTISSVLCQMYYLFGLFRNPNFNNISESYLNEPRKFMISQRKPITNFLRKVDKENGIYALDSDSGLFKFKNNILMSLGKVLERSITLPADIFNKALLKSYTSSGGPVPIIDDDHHRFMKLNNEICLRSQIDCHDFNPETGDPFVFEIKTRSVCPIRYDLFHYEDYFDYKIDSYRGLHSSFEREYYDLIRGGFLKYCFQLKIGRMDGAFIAYHNTKEIFGFEYVKTKEIERRIFGNEIYADATFVACSKLLTVLLNNVLDALKDEKHEMLKLGFYADSTLKKMVVFAELFDENVSWGDQNLIDATDDIKDEYDYFTKYTKLNNKVFKFEFQIFVYINGILQKGPGHELSRGDQIEIKYKFNGLGQPTFTDYMNFLHEAYKFEALNIDLTYVGAWVK